MSGRALGCTPGWAARLRLPTAPPLRPFILNLPSPQVKVPGAPPNHRSVRYMSGGSFSISERRNALAFWLGSAGVSAGVLLHLPMFWMARNTGFMSGRDADGCGHAVGDGADCHRDRGRRLRAPAEAHSEDQRAGIFCAARGHPARQRALEADGRTRRRLGHRHHEAGEPRVRDAGHAHGVRGHERDWSRCCRFRRSSARRSDPSSGVRSRTSMAGERPFCCRRSCSSALPSAARCPPSGGTSPCAF